MSDNSAGSSEAEQGLMGASDTVASFEEESGSPLKNVQAFLHNNPTAIPIIVMVVSVIAFAFISRNFFAPLNLSLILQQVTVIGVVATAQTLVILTAGIDLSVGAMMVLSAIVMGRAAVVWGIPMEIAWAMGLATGTFCGLINGLLVAFLRLPPFIVTLGTWYIYQAMITLVSKSETIRQPDIEAVGPLLQSLGTRINFGGGWVIIPGSILMIGLAILTYYMLTRTAFGRHIYAVGDDPTAARLAGINVRRTLIKVYTLAGFICGIAGWVLIGRIGAASPLGNQEANLEAITAVVIGGTSLFGGRGSIVGTMFGALIVGVFNSGLALAGLDPLWRLFTVGVLIITAVAIDQWIRRISS
jgi:fructose transport system permease protein